MLDLVVHTKLSAPQIEGKILHRERLLGQLKENLNKRLILICADAGYGKTTLLAQFCARFDRSFVFYNLDDSDNEIAVFFNYLVSGIQRHCPGFGQLVKGIVPQTRNIEIIVGTFINEFVEKVMEDFYIILDDYHHLQQNKEIGYALDYLLHHLPANLHLIISSRSIPQLNLAYYFAKQYSFNIEKEQLRFRLEEIRSLLREIYGLIVPDNEIGRIEKHSEGWITAIQLILQKIAATGEAKETLNGYVASGEEVFNYFASEVFESQANDVQEFLLKTSILDHMNGEICKKVLKMTDPEGFLKYLLEEHLFITPINGNFRYHSLFKNFLVKRLKTSFGNDEINKWYEKAGAFFKMNRDPSRAIIYFLAAQRFETAAQLMEKHASDLISKGQINQLFEWIDQIPAKVLHTHPRLLIHKAEGNIFIGKCSESLTDLAMAERILSSKENRKAQAEILSSRGVALFRLGKIKESLTALAKANNLLGPASHLLRIKILNFMGWIKSNTGEYMKAKGYFEKGILLSQKVRNRQLEAQLINALAVLEYRQSNLDKALEYYEFLINRFRDEILSPSNLANIYGNAGSIYIEREEYKKAEDLIGKAEDLAHKFNDQRSILYLTGVRGKFYLQQRHYDKAAEYFEKVLVLNQNFGEERINIFAYLDLVSIFKEREDYVKAEKYLNRAGEIMKEKKGMDYLQYLYLKAELKSIFGDPTSAERIFKNAIALATKLKAYRYIFKSYLFLFQKNIENQKRGKALDYLNEAIAVSKKYSADEFFIQELEHDDGLLENIMNQDVKNGHLINILRRIKSPEAPDTLTKSSIELFAKRAACDSRIYLFGGLRLEDPVGKNIEPRWLTRKTRSLFAFLIANRKAKSQRDSIIEQFWPDVSIKEGRHNLQMSISFLRRLLHEITGKRIKYKDLIRYQNCCYYMNTGLVFIVDSEVFENLVRKGEWLETKNKEKSIELHKRAISIYQGDYGIDIYDPWCEEKRMYYRELCCKILKKVAEYHYLKGDYEESLSLYRRALIFNKYDETTHCGLMQNFAGLGNTKAITDQYNHLTKILKDELSASPSIKTQKTFQSLLKRQ